MHCLSKQMQAILLVSSESLRKLENGRPIAESWEVNNAIEKKIDELTKPVAASSQGRSHPKSRARSQHSDTREPSRGKCNTLKN